MNKIEWESLKAGDVIQHEEGSIETIVEYNGEKYIDGEKSIFPLSEFIPGEWTKISRPYVSDLEKRKQK